MAATPYSGACPRPRSRPLVPGCGSCKERLLLLLLASGAVVASPHRLAAQTDLPAPHLAAAASPEMRRAERALSDARARFQAAAANAEAGWQSGRACFDWAEFATNDTQRAAIATEGIAACRQAMARDPNLGAAHYYLAMNLGQLARTKSLGALKLVTRMEAAFQTAIALDPGFDYAGPHRSLGLLYLQAPGWPTSIGSRKQARAHLRKAVELAPSHPENRLCLLEAYLEWGDRKAVQPELKPVEEVLRQARARYTGEQWEGAWKDWDARWARAQAKAAEPVSRLRSPRDG